MKVVAIIPARYNSERLPGKPLLRLKDASLIQWVYLRTKKAETLDDVVVATDDERIIREIKSVGGKAMMTSSEHSSGTDRIAEVAKDLNYDLIVNVQGDEPFIDPDIINKLVTLMMENPDDQIGTVAYPFPENFSPDDPDKVKVVLDKENYALYFSRCPIPYNGFRKTHSNHYLHLGIYAYRRDFLFEFTKMPRSPLELAEKLEQLRALENGYRIRVALAEYEGFGIDNPDDYKKALNFIEKKGIGID